MKRFVFFMLASVALLGAFVSFSKAKVNSAESKFVVDAVHSSIVFRITHLDAAAFWGRFNSPTGSFAFNGDDLTVDVTIDIAKIDTANKGRDEHLRGSDYFNAPEFPKATFKSKSAKKTGENTWDVTGDLVIRGQTKSVTLSMTKIGEATHEKAGHRAGIEGELTIKRSEFGIGTPEGLGDDVKLFIALEGKA
ncbi:MAG TPA: YceI family protein [Tepidisphaeraceae bacterium]|nr:YceI family protein [Tepidisphaeraceae bacterium]